MAVPATMRPVPPAIRAIRAMNEIYSIRIACVNGDNPHKTLTRTIGFQSTSGLVVEDVGLQLLVNGVDFTQLCSARHHLGGPFLDLRPETQHDADFLGGERQIGS